MSKQSRVKVFEPKQSRGSRSVSLDLSKSSQFQIIKIPAPKPIQFNQRLIDKLDYLGQFDNKIILTYCPSLKQYCLFDQHAIHERIRYEYYVRKLRRELGIITKAGEFHVATRAQLLTIPAPTIEFRPPHEIKTILTRLQKTLVPVPEGFLPSNQSQATTCWGFRFQRLKGRTYLTQYPVILDKELSVQQIQEYLASVDKNQVYCSKNLPKILDQTLCNFSCKAAIKFGHRIQPQLARDLIKALVWVDYPFHCVHGRSTLIAVNRQTITT